jgi:beta-lactamase regulating signal transducer with metallopeptidase domain
MLATEWFALPMSRVVTLTLLHFLWQGFAIAFLLLFVVEFCRVRRAAARYAWSLVALICLALTPLTTLILLTISHAPSTIAVFTPFDLASRPAPAVVAFRNYWLETAEPFLLAAWFGGVVLFGSRLLSGVAGVSRLRQSRLPVPDKLMEMVTRLGQQLKIDANSVVYLSEQVADAMAIGLVRPLVLIPAAWVTEMPLEMLEAVIAHELAHLARRDLWVNLLQRMVETVLFYHPAVWWLSRRLRIERELCADEMAVAATGKRLEYAQALEHIAGKRLAEIRPALAAFLRGENDMRLLQRVRNVLDQPPQERSRLWPAGLAALALPLGIWAAAAYNSKALADDDERKPAIKRETEVREQTKRVQRDKPEAGRRVEVEVEEERPARSRFLIEERRDGQKPEATEVREEGYTIIRDGKPVEERRIVRRDDKPVTVDVTSNKLGIVSDASDRRIDELTALVKQLSRNVERLQDEVSQLRGLKPAKGESNSNLDLPIKHQTTLEIRKRALQQEQEKIEAVQRDVEAQVKAIARKAEAAGQEAQAQARVIAEKARQQAVAERDAAVKKKEEAKQQFLKKQEIEKKEIEKLEGAEERASKKREAGANEEKSQAAPRLKAEARSRTIIDARGIREEQRSDHEKARQEIEKLEQKLRDLKEGRLKEVDLELNGVLNPQAVKGLARQQQAQLTDAKPEPKPAPAKLAAPRREPPKTDDEQDAAP